MGQVGEVFHVDLQRRKVRNRKSMILIDPVAHWFVAFVADNYVTVIKIVAAFFGHVAQPATCFTVRPIEIYKLAFWLSGRYWSGTTCKKNGTIYSGTNAL